MIFTKLNMSIIRNLIYWRLLHQGLYLSFISKHISVLVLDIDYFKKVNDTYGHDQGDVILKFIASHLKNSLRKEDIVIRWGAKSLWRYCPNAGRTRILTSPKE
ncbi:MAG: GGDEF domain-containing protein [Acetobacterium woodii]|nr:GGDEF domain-containing protein [Acetobacterium woodii]